MGRPGQLRVVFGTHSELLLSGDYGRSDGIPLTYAKPIVAKPGSPSTTPTSLWEVRTSHLASGKNSQQGASAKLAVRLNQHDDADQSDGVSKIQLSLLHRSPTRPNCRS